MYGRVLCSLLLGTSLLLTGPLPAQTLPPQPIVTGTPSPSPEPTAAPIPVTTSPPAGTPQVTLTPGVPDLSVLTAYNALRTPLVDVTLGTATSFRATMPGGNCGIIRLPAPSNNPSSGATATANAQPVATVLLTYDPSRAGQLVWVQMLGGGTLSASDGAGHTYDGTNGFFLTLDINAMATFNYQAPDVSGTYQILTRLSNVMTPLSFLVPDPGS